MSSSKLPQRSKSRRPGWLAPWHRASCAGGQGRRRRCVLMGLTGMLTLGALSVGCVSALPPKLPIPDIPPVVAPPPQPPPTTPPPAIQPPVKPPVITPPVVVEPPKVPTGGGLMSILTTIFPNPPGSPLPRGGPTFPNSTGFPSYDPLDPILEWTPIFGPEQNVAVAGFAVAPEISGNDLPFSHPFGFDFEFGVVPDYAFYPLLAESNQGRPGVDDGEYIEWVEHARNDMKLVVERGVIGVETDNGLVPGSDPKDPSYATNYSHTDYRPREGDRVVVFGRWITDTGHADYHTEIHPPLFLVAAHKANNGEETHSTIVGRPWLVGQTYQGDNQPFVSHIRNEIRNVFMVNLPLVGWVPLPSFIPGSLRLEAHPNIEPTITAIQALSYDLAPEQPRQKPGDALDVHYHFTIRDGVTVNVLSGVPDQDHVRVLATMNQVLYKPAPLPHKNDWSIGMDYLDKVSPDASKWATAILVGLGILVDPVKAIVISRGILTDLYDAPVPFSPHDGEMDTVSVDNSQPFPIYGWLDVRWQREGRSLPPIITPPIIGPPVIGPPIRPPEPAVTMGDLNSDHQVTIADAAVALRIAVGLTDPTPDQLAATDFDKTGNKSTITLGDVTRILRFAVGLSPSL